MESLELPERLAVLVYEAVAGAYGSTVSFDEAHSRTKEYYIEAACRLAGGLDSCLIEELRIWNARVHDEVERAA